jgi:hypothetical protein
MEIIHVIWCGPFTIEAAESKYSDIDFGVYQIYGTHQTTGSDTLLYIGKAQETRFGARMNAHQAEWGRWEASRLAFYLGRIGWREGIDDSKWGLLIDKAEATLIWKIAPPYNSARIKSIPYYPDSEEEVILVVNHGLRNKLPECVSTLTEVANKDNGLRFIGEERDWVRPTQPNRAAEDDPDESGRPTRAKPRNTANSGS